MKLWGVTVGWFLWFIFGSSLAWSQAQIQPQTQTQELYLSYEQRLLANYLIQSIGQPAPDKVRVFLRMGKLFADMAEQPVEVINVNSFSEFLAADRGVFPETYSLDLDMSIIEKGSARGFKMIDSEDPVLAQQIREYKARRNEFLRNLGNELGAQVDYPVLENLAKQGKFIEISEALLSERGVIEKAFENQMHGMRDVGRQMAQMLATKNAGSGAAGFTLVLSEILRLYYSNLGLNSKKLIYSQFLAGNLTASPIEKFAVMVENSGPQFQKLLQIISRDFQSTPELTAIFKKLESSVRPVSPHLVKQVIEAERANFAWRSYEIKPLGVGTMAQIHRGEIETDNGVKNVAIRLIKPGIEKRVQEDKLILKEIAPALSADPRIKASGVPNLESLVEAITQSVLAELELEQTMLRQEKGREKYHQIKVVKTEDLKTEIQFTVPEVIRGHSASQKLMVQELASGQSMDKFVTAKNKEGATYKQAIVEKMAEVWLEEVIFRSGFFHSDLHQGNFMVKDDGNELRVTILDFGMGGTINQALRERFLLFALGTVTYDYELMAHSLYEMSQVNKNKISRGDFAKRVEELVGKIRGRKLVDLSSSQWVAWAIDQGMVFPDEFIGLNRGVMIIEALLRDAGSQLDVIKVGRVLAIKNAWQVLKTIRHAGQLTWGDILKQGYRALFPPEVIPFGKACRAVFRFAM
jgi:ubiquinone biosynthesis protein